MEIQHALWIGAAFDPLWSGSQQFQQVVNDRPGQCLYQKPSRHFDSGFGWASRYCTSGVHGLNADVPPKPRRHGDGPTALLACPGVRPLRVDSEVIQGVLHRLRLSLARFHQCAQGGDHDGGGVHLKMTAQNAALVTAPEAVGSQRDHRATEIRADQVRQGVLVVTGRDD